MLRKVFKGSHNEDITGSTATLFVSHANLSDSRGTRLLRQDSVVRDNNKAIVQELLANFNMEETKEKYMESKVVEICWDSNDFSFDSALSTARVRARLQQLMGTDVIRLNDKNYIDEMLLKLEDERQNDVKKKEQALADAEKERLRKLHLDGVLSNTGKSNTTQRRSTGKKSLQQKSFSSSNKNIREEKIFKGKEEMEETERQEVLTQIEAERKSGKKQETNTKGAGDVRKVIADKESEIQIDVKIARNQEKDYKGESPKESGKYGKSTHKQLQKETAFVREINGAKTIDDLYKVADRLLSFRSEDYS